MALIENKHTAQCDYCLCRMPAENPGPYAYYPEGWVTASEMGPLTGTGDQPSLAFCSWDCCTRYARSKAEDE
jgi:hypothetical protein